MKLRLQPALRGLLWFRMGFLVVRRQPLAVLGLFLMLFFGAMLVSSVPLAGPVLALALMPALTVGFMLATRAVVRGQLPVPPTVLLQPLRSPARALLWRQGLIYATLALGGVFAADWLDGGALQRWVETQEAAAQAGTGNADDADLPGAAPASAAGPGAADPRPDLAHLPATEAAERMITGRAAASPAGPGPGQNPGPAAPSPPSAAGSADASGTAAGSPAQPAASQPAPAPPLDAAVGRSLVTRLLLMLPLAVLFWHAGALAYWHRIPVVKSLFFSAVACVRNGSAFLLYGASWGLLAVLVALLLQLATAAFGSGAAAAVLVMPVTLLVLAAFWASLYFTYHDCFEHPLGGPTQPAAPAA